MAVVLLGVAVGIIFAQREPHLSRDGASSPPESTAIETPEAPSTPARVSASSLEEVPPPEGVPASEEAAADEQVRSWRREYYEADDHFAFAVEATKAARDGDRRAQYFLSRALRDCHIQIGPLKHSGLGVDEYLEQLFSRFPHSPPNQIRNKRQRIVRCERFLSADSLTRLSAPPDPQEHGYWFEQSVANKDPLAVMERINVALVDLDNADPEAAHQIKSQARSAVRVAVASKEPAAIAAVGTLFWFADIARDHSLQGPAWLMAACQLGYECTAENPELMLLNCDYQATCPTLQDILMRDFGAEYGEIYAASQDIVYKIENGDWDGLQRYLEMK